MDSVIEFMSRPWVGPVVISMLSLIIAIIMVTIEKHIHPERYKD